MKSASNQIIREFVVLSLVIALGACNAGSSAGPSTVISVRVLDDIGGAAGRNQIIVTPPAAARVDASTRYDGTAEIRVTDAGIYVVKVIPSNGYVAGQDPLSKTVNVVSNGTATVEFTLQRAGVSTAEPIPGR